MEKKKLPKAVRIILSIVGILVLVVIGYLLFVVLTYNRIEDNVPLVAEGQSKETQAKINQEYTIVTQNVGFGAYTADYTFFMDGGTESRAASRESVVRCIDQALDTTLEASPDFLLFQEVDTDSTRSYHVNQYQQMQGRLTEYSSTYAVNYHSAYLMYPVFEPHGASNSGIATFSSVQIVDGLRRQLPISESLAKLIDLDRCYSYSRVKTENGKELVLFNVHLSAYTSDGDLKADQMRLLFSDMEAEYKKGNYVVCGGDFNADFTGTSLKNLNKEGVEPQGWTMPFPNELIPEHFVKCVDYTNKEELPTCRNCDIPYGEDNLVVIVDGFIVSDNVQVTELENKQTGFTYSDHGPVIMRFILSE